ncbi:MFS transporter [Weissella cibaria]|uniref:MFS transporter n=1 Tax=Weissella cibaria TaxID=137591 RepID=UPI000706579E|nr:MFS transporter [Weissella cibaria]ALI32239.1 Na+/xyloside symporter related transporter [Weissella cibaria]MBD1502807.1 MFS transporter [Weissella cibaria]WCE25096.1 MFS transporter [Weissella cibaria]WCE27284.1 MFS transporter [Weissella cibaria]
MDANVKNDEFAKLSLMDRVAYGLGDFAQNLVFGTVGGFLLFYLSTVNGISAATGATIFLIVRLVNVVWDPWVGATVDRRDPKGGKYLPYIRNFGIPLVILAAMLFLPFGQWFPAIKLPFAFLSYLATAMIYSFVNIPYGALNASLTRDNEEIAKLTTVRMTLANVANLMVYTLFPLFVQLATSVGRESKDIGMFGIHLNLGNYASPQSAGAWFKVYAVYMVIGFIALMITYSKTKERVLPEKNQEQVKYSDLFAEFKRNKPLQILGLFFLVGFTFNFFGSTAWPFFLQYNIGHSEWNGSISLIGSIPGIFLVALWPLIRSKVGKKGFFYLFLAMFSAGSLVLWIWTKTPDTIALGYVGRFLQQWGLTSATGFMWSLVPEVVSYGEYTSKKRVAGIINAIMGLFFKLGLALGGIIPGYINAATGFDGAKKVQSATALMGVQWSMVWLPIIMAIVAGIIIAKYPLMDDKVAEMNHEIENRRNNK